MRVPVPIAYVSRQLGHSSIKVTVDLYDRNSYDRPQATPRNQRLPSQRLALAKFLK